MTRLHDHFTPLAVTRRLYGSKEPGMRAWSPPVRHVVTLVMAAACGLHGLLDAQSATGKLEGRVRDPAGGAIAQAQVHLTGTAFSAETDSQGYYFINNVPAGSWAVRAIFLGHRPVEIRDLRVFADQTTTQHFILSPAPLQLQEITVVAAENPLVPRDEVTTKQRVDGQMADDLPVDRMDDILALQPGVLPVSRSALSGGGRESDRGLSIRGGRETQNVTYIDGVPVQAGYKGDRLAGRRDLGSTGASLIIGTNAVEEASVTTGSSSAEFGNATGGIISIVTRTGTDRYQGSFGFETDEVFGVNHGPGVNRFQGGLSGPLAGRVTFAINGVLEGLRSVEEGFGSRDSPIFLPVGVDTTVRQLSILKDDTTTRFIDEGLTANTTLVNVYRYAVSRGRCDQFAASGSVGVGDGDSTAIQAMRNNYGFDCNGVRLPATARTLHSLSGKVNYTYGDGSRLSLSLGGSRFHGHRFDFIINHYNGLAGGVSRGFNNRNRLATLNWVQNLARSAERALALDLSVSFQQDRTISGPLTAQGRLSTLDPAGGFILGPMEFLYDFDTFPVDDQLIDNVRRSARGTRTTPRPPGNESYANPDDLRNNAYGLYGRFPGFEVTMGGVGWIFGESRGVPPPLPLSLYHEERYVGKTALDWQADRYNRLKLGGEVTRYAISHYASFLDDRAGSEAYIEHPVRWSAFVDDRLDLGDVVVVGGLRYDWYHSRASRPYATDTTGARYQFPRISTMPRDPQDDLTAHFLPDRSHDYLSPHVQVSFPVTERTNFRLSYSHQVQAPDFGLVFEGINGDLSFSPGQAYGSDLDFGKTIALEFGIRHAFSDDMVLDVAAYSKNIIADPAVRLVSLYDPVQLRNSDFRILTNLDFGYVRGVDVRLDLRFGSFFNGTIAYAYQAARNTGSDPFTYVNYGSRIVNQVGGINGVQPPPQAVLPTDDSRPHALTGAFALTFPAGWKPGSLLGGLLANLAVFTTFRYTSGTAYSRCGTGVDDQSALSSEGCQREFPEGLNTQRLPAYKELSARFTKSFGLGGMDLTAYLDVRNLLNFKNVLQVFAANGSTRNDLERRANLRDDLRDLLDEAGLNRALDPDSSGSILLPAAHEECAGWISTQQFRPAAGNCIYLIRAEQRFGNGDGVYTVGEQSRAINALYDVARGEQQHTSAGRRARVGLEINF
jgi:hypothetical protein